MRTSQRLQHDVQVRLQRNLPRWARCIDVTVSDGVVTLTGSVESYTDQIAAENTAGAVPGVKAVHDEIRVRQAHGDQDAERELIDHVVGAL